jgi:hypothetical protein
VVTSSRRGFTVAHAMILVASTALGYYLVSWDMVTNAMNGIIHKNYRACAYVFAGVIHPVWLIWTFAALIIRLLPPRPAFRRLARQPGMIASVSVSLGAPIYLVLLMLSMRRTSLEFNRSFLNNYIGSLHGTLCWMVFGAWLAQALRRQWRPEPSAIDRFGRLLGFGWIGFFPLEILWENLFR